MDQQFSGRETASNTKAAMKPGLGRTLGRVSGSRKQRGGQCGWSSQGARGRQDGEPECPRSHGLSSVRQVARLG